MEKKKKHGREHGCGTRHGRVPEHTPNTPQIDTALLWASAWHRDDVERVEWTGLAIFSATPSPRAFYISLWRSRPVRILAGEHGGRAGSPHVHLSESLQTAFSEERTNARGLGVFSAAVSAPQRPQNTPPKTSTVLSPHLQECTAPPSSLPCRC